MKLVFITLFAILGHFAIAAVPLGETDVQPPTETPSLDANLYLNEMQRRVQLVRDVKDNLNGVDIVKKINEETEKLIDYSATYSSKVQTLVSGIRHLILTTQDDIHDAIANMHESCSFADVLLGAFLDMSNTDDIASRNQLLKDFFDSDSNTKLEENLKKATDTLNNASSLVSTILTEFDSDFTEQSPLFEVLLRDELLNDENKRYPAGVFNVVFQALKKYVNNPELLRQDLSSTNNASAVDSAVGTHIDQQEQRQFTNQQQHSEQLNNQQEQSTPEQAAEQLNNQREQAAEQLNNQGEQSTTENPAKQTTVDPQLYGQLKDRVFTKFQSTRNFFTDYKSSIDTTISSIDEIKAKVSGNNPGGAIVGNVQPQVSLNNDRASSDRQLNTAAKALKNTCINLMTTNARILKIYD